MRDDTLPTLLGWLKRLYNHEIMATLTFIAALQNWREKKYYALAQKQLKKALLRTFARKQTSTKA
jgi:hypothetical protein